LASARNCFFESLPRLSCRERDPLEGRDACV
jgi:hypothetical protein